MMNLLGRLSFGGKAEEKKSVIQKHGATKWIMMTDPASDKGSPIMTVETKAAEEVLIPLGATNVNLVSILGSARGGKSFLMNQLSHRSNVFKISNDKDPCTVGVDLSREVLSHAEFSSVEAKAARDTRDSSSPRVLMADVEGQGDRDVTYDARLASAILPLSKCVIFNWKDSLQVDRILNQLTVLKLAAHNIDQSVEGTDEGSDVCFGHLHIVFRDWSYTGTAEEVKKQIFDLVKKPKGDEAMLKNELRRILLNSFESITVWLFPPPVEQTRNLSKELDASDLSDEFKQQLKALRSALSSQLREPTIFGDLKLTGSALARLVPSLVHALNSAEAIMPRSACRAMISANVEALRKKFELVAENEIFLPAKDMVKDAPISNADITAEVQSATTELLNLYHQAVETEGLAIDPAEVELQANLLKSVVEKGLEGVLDANYLALADHRRGALQSAREMFDKAAREGKSDAASEALALGVLRKIPVNASDKRSMRDAEEAESSLLQYCELAGIKAKREAEEREAKRIREEEELKAMAKQEAARALNRSRTAVAAALEKAKSSITSSASPMSNQLKGGGGGDMSTITQMHTQAVNAAEAHMLRQLKADDVDDGSIQEAKSRLEEFGATVHSQLQKDFLDAIAEVAKRGLQMLREELDESVTRQIKPLLPMSEEKLEQNWKFVVQRGLDRRRALFVNFSFTLQQAEAMELDVQESVLNKWKYLCEMNRRMCSELESEAAKREAQNAHWNAEQANAEKNRVEADLECHKKMTASATAAAAQKAVQLRERERQLHEQQMREQQMREQEEREKARLQEEREKAQAQEKIDAMDVEQNNANNDYDNDEGFESAQEEEEHEAGDVAMGGAPAKGTKAASKLALARAEAEKLRRSNETGWDGAGARGGVKDVRKSLGSGKKEAKPSAARAEAKQPEVKPEGATGRRKSTGGASATAAAPAVVDNSKEAQKRKAKMWAEEQAKLKAARK